MIREIFVPCKIGSYYLFPQRIVGIDIGRTKICATVAQCRARAIRIEKSITLSLANGTSADYEERVADALKKCVKQVGAYNSICSAISSAHAIFKKLTLPFSDREKIKLVIEHEIERLLPFPLDDALVDFVVSSVDASSGQAQVLAAAIQKQYMIRHLALFAQAGIDPTTVTVGAFALQDVHTLVAQKDRDGLQVIIDIGFGATTIVCLHQGAMVEVRALPTGISSLAKKLSAQLNINAARALELMLRFGMNGGEDKQYQASIADLINQLLDEVEQTVAGCVQVISDTEKPDAITLLGGGSEIAGITDAVCERLAAPCSVLSHEHVQAGKAVTIAGGVTLNPTALVSVALAVPMPATEQINFRQKEFGEPESGLFTRQLITAVAFFVLILSGMVVHTYRQSRLLTQSIKRSRTQVELQLRAALPIEEDTVGIEDVLQSAKDIVKREKEMWSAFFGHTRSSFSHALVALSSKIDPDDLGLELRRLVLTRDALVLQGRVKEWQEGGGQALDTFREQLLETGLFEESALSRDLFQDVRFRLTISLKKSAKGGSDAATD